MVPYNIYSRQYCHITTTNQHGSNSMTQLLIMSEFSHMNKVILQQNNYYPSTGAPCKLNQCESTNTTTKQPWRHLLTVLTHAIAIYRMKTFTLRLPRAIATCCTYTEGWQQSNKGCNGTIQPQLLTMSEFSHNEVIYGQQLRIKHGSTTKQMSLHEPGYNH